MDVLSQLVTAMSVGRPRAFVVECRAPWGRTYAPVPGAGFHVVLEGAATLIRPDGPPRQLGMGDVVLLPTGVGHGLASGPDASLIDMDYRPSDSHLTPDRVRIGPDGPETHERTLLLCGSYLFDAHREHPVLRRLPAEVHLPARLGERTELGTVTALLARELTQKVPGRQLAVESLLDLLLITVLRAWHERHPDETWAVALTDPAIADVLQVIHADPQHQWTVEALATKVGMSRATFSKRFTRLVGRPPLEYLTWWRMTLAARLLQDGDRVLADIAGQVGYGSPYAFANTFKRHHGVPPGRYRRALLDRVATTSAN